MRSQRRTMAGGLLLVFLVAACSPNLTRTDPSTTTLTAAQETGDMIAREPQSPENASEVAINTTAPTCFYSGFGIGAPHLVYADFPPSSSIAVGEAQANVAYQALARTEDRLKIHLSSTVIGWVNDGTGELRGMCDNLPFQPTRPSPPDNICTIINPQPDFDYDVRTEPNGGQVIAALPHDVYIRAEAQTREGMLGIVLPDGTRGWIERAPFGSLGWMFGPCDELPVDETPIGG